MNEWFGDREWRWLKKNFFFLLLLFLISSLVFKLVALQIEIQNNYTRNVKNAFYPKERQKKTQRTSKSKRKMTWNYACRSQQRQSNAQYFCVRNHKNSNWTILADMLMFIQQKWKLSQNKSKWRKKKQQLDDKDSTR